MRVSLNLKFITRTLKVETFLFFQLKPLLNCSKKTLHLCTAYQWNQSISFKYIKKKKKVNQTCHIAPGSLFEAGSLPWIESEQQAKGNSPFADLLTSMLKQEWCWLLKRNQLGGLNFSATAIGNGKFFFFFFFISVVIQGQREQTEPRGVLECRNGRNRPLSSVPPPCY